MVLGRAPCWPSSPSLGLRTPPRRPVSGLDGSRHRLPSGIPSSRFADARIVVSALEQPSGCPESTRPARHIHDIQKQTSDDITLGEARERRDAVLGAGRTFGGVSGSYISGSVAAGVVIDKVDDADGGLIADRHCFLTLGHDRGR